jgi:hypothetical protein
MGRPLFASCGPGLSRVQRDDVAASFFAHNELRQACIRRALLEKSDWR